ncbi:MAG: ATP-binding cassette domain-containing protein [Bacteroidales bacterium]|nr:ATP-binding cassette domain-containing protein [Bacteroidales bacterium]
MSESILNALVQLFALIADIHGETVITSRGKDVVRAFLSRHLNNELLTRYMRKFEEYLVVYNAEDIERDSIRDRKRISLSAVKILTICQKINEELQQKQKMYVLIQLMDFISLGEEVTENELDFLATVADSFFVPSAEYNDIKSFVIDDTPDPYDSSTVVVTGNRKDQGPKGIRHIYNEHLEGSLSFLFIASTNTYIFRYIGNVDLYLNGQNIIPGQTYIFDHGSSIRGSGIRTIYYTDISSRIAGDSFACRVSLDAEAVSFMFSNSDNGIHDLHFHGESGELIGIMGGSGVGKSTTLSILSGTLRPQGGEVRINGHDLYNHTDREKLKGVIGFVPQDDLLIEELTVFQNIWFNARMCLNNLGEDQIIETVNGILADFDLSEIKDFKVGNPLNKVISGGQRKRVNIALELLREPTILFVDEPTSGLSSVDAEAVMNLLKEQTHKGRLVIVNIHQPGSEIYKMFDKIMIIDKGGYQVYFGNPTEAIVYFKTITRHANPEEDQCVKCGNVDTDQILQIVEAKVIDEQGRATGIRKVTPAEWADQFRAIRKNSDREKIREKTSLPRNNFSIPGLLKQSRIFFARDLLSKLSDRQYILISILGPPLLAFLLAYFTRYSADGIYRFSENDNITPYLFMCIITALFFGLMVSSEEIVRDRKILRRESFLNLSWLSYLGSKVMLLFIISAIQTISFTLIGNLLLGIKGMTFSFWFVLFTTSCFANILGLNISAALNSVVTIYIIIPFIIIPQLLFSGVLVRFEKLHLADFSSAEYVPLVGDMMTARWSFEALAVTQFRDNAYERNYFGSRADVSRHEYNIMLVNSLRNHLQQVSLYRDREEYHDELENKLHKLDFHIGELSASADVIPGKWKDDLSPERFRSETGKDADKWLDSLKGIYSDLKKQAGRKENEISSRLVNKLGEEGLVRLREDNENKWLRNLMLSHDRRELTMDTDTRIIRKYEPAYMKATSKWGRAHFYAPVKRLGSLEFNTCLFNMAVVWAGSVFFFVLLYFNLIRKLLEYIENLRLPGTDP